MEEATTMRALELPDILASIALRLEGEDLHRFRAVCKAFRDVLSDGALWAELVSRRFGKKCTEGPPKPWERYYFTHAQPRNALSGPRSTVCWGDTPQYFVRTERDGAFSEHVMQLRMVCWLDLGSRFEGVTEGTYRVVWRMLFDVGAGSFNLEYLHMDAFVTAMRDNTGLALDFTASPDAIDKPAQAAFTQLNVVAVEEPGFVASLVGSAPRPRLEPAQPLPEVDLMAPDCDGVFFRTMMSQATVRTLAEKAGRKWVEIEAGQVTVPVGRVVDVQARMYDISGHWKGGLVWDCVSLVPAKVEEDFAVANRSAPADRELTPRPVSARGKKKLLLARHTPPQRPTGNLAQRMWRGLMAWFTI